ncbi:uncharacterized protein LOC109863693 isoform X2 [Pseudomyrmex gracilis]|uniref:uncharacterized protein LOC109863693 isoform X2 n=1 Tax=Pseudomyrmex gracilis TaxID=219809 RepID=UPI000994AED8|nr:uncharacterized protein LOC109863693 isoform X2 [Pseudomyrmex gracilis]
MDGANVNGGNTRIVSEDPNLESADGGDSAVQSMPETQNSPLSGKTQSTAGGNADTQGINGDLKATSKKPGTQSLRRRTRKSITDGNVMESVVTRTRKRRHSNLNYASSDDSEEEFNGFEMHGLDSQPGSHVLKKLIAEAEIAEAQFVKRIRYSRRSLDDKKEDDQDFDHTRAYIYETDSFGQFDMEKIKREKESDKSETDSIDMPNSIDSEIEPSKIESVSIKSANSSATSSPSAASQRSRSSRISRGPSPGGRQKVVDMSNPLYKEPFKHGWKRELVFRATNDNSLKRMADIYYYTPTGKKVRSFREVAECLNSKELKIDHFTFFKEPIGLDDPEKEIVRDAKKMRGSMGGYGKKSPARKFTPIKKSAQELAVKKIVQEPATKKPVQEPQVPVQVAATTPTSVSTEASKPSSVPVSVPTRATKSTKVSTPTVHKTKTAAKKTPQIKMKSPAEEIEMLPPQRSIANTRRNQQIAEKVVPVKAKRSLPPKVQEPCSIRCSTSMGLIPSLQCRICLCLYHPECVDGREVAGSDEYVCKNCQPDTKDSHTSNNPTLTPPPLIPISMLGTQNAKSKHQANAPPPPKLQRIPKNSDNADTQMRNPSKVSKTMSATSNTSSTTDKKETAWFPQTENEFLQSHDGTMPKPAQNIALMGGKRYIVVPKNNAMAVQPAITVKPDKIGDKPPILQDGLLTDISNTVDNAVEKPHAPLFKHLNTDASENVNVMSDKEMSKDATNDVTHLVSSAVTEELDNKDSKDNKDEEVQITKNNKSSPKRDKSIENLSETKSSTAAIDDTAEENKAATSRESPERKLECTPVSSENIVSDVETKIIKPVERQQSSKAGTVKKVKNIKYKDMCASRNTKALSAFSRKFSQSSSFDPISNPIKKSQEVEQQQNFMVSICAGYNALLRIFQYLKVQELLRAARVCKMWRDLAAHPSLWKTVRMKNSQVTDWEGLADTLQRRGTQYLDLRKMLVAGESDLWKKFLTVIPRVTSLVKLELCKCPVMVVEEVIKNCPQLEVLSAMSIKCDSLNLESVGNLKQCQELRLKAISGMSLQQDLTPLQELKQLTQLSLTSVRELGKKKIDIIQALTNLETLELGECSDFPDKFGTNVLIKLNKLERLRLEKGQGSCCTFNILEGVSKLENLSQMELVNFDVKNGFDKCLANCKNIKRLLIIPTYISQSATSNNMVLGGVTELSNNLTHFVWGVTLELLRVTELFVDQCNLTNKQVNGDSIPVLKPVPCLNLVKNTEEETENQKGDKSQSHLTSPQVDILPLPQLQKLLLTALPKTRVKILKIPFHATWRQSISDTAT